MVPYPIMHPGECCEIQSALWEALWWMYVLGLAESRVTSLICCGHFLMWCSLPKGRFALVGLCTARCWSPIYTHTILLQVWEIFSLFLMRTQSLSFPFFHFSPTYTLTNTHKDLQCWKSYIRGTESSIKGVSVQLYSGVKTALDRNPCGLSLASITMQHTSEAQQAALQSYYMGTGALTHTHSHKQQQHIYVQRKPHACTHYRNDPLCVAAKQDASKENWVICFVDVLLLRKCVEEQSKYRRL